VKASINAYWLNLNERERWTLGFGVVFCVAYLFYLLIYSPLVTAVHNKSQQLLEKQETLVWMQQVRHQHNTRKPPQMLTSSKLLTVLAEQLNATSFKQFSYQLQQTGVSDIQLVFDKVPYNAFVAWLWAMSEKYSISIKQLSIERTDTPGVVKLLLVVAT
jgi:general secretion pathway protein M